MNAINELMSATFYPTVEGTAQVATKTELEKSLEKLQKKLEKLEQSALTKNGFDLHSHIRLNRPLKWKYKWNGEKKYATLGKERLEFWHGGWDQWRAFEHYEAAETHPRIPK